MTYFISYHTKGEFGYVCYSGIMTEVWLKNRLFDNEIAILFVSSFYPSKKTLVSFVTNNKFKHEILNRSISDVEELGDVWLYLRRKYKDVHILSFKALSNELKQE